jgi:hypothetical protein
LEQEYLERELGNTLRIELRVFTRDFFGATSGVWGYDATIWNGRHAMRPAYSIVKEF